MLENNNFVVGEEVFVAAGFDDEIRIIKGTLIKMLFRNCPEKKEKYEIMYVAAALLLNDISCVRGEHLFKTFKGAIGNVQRELNKL